jgi:hypothetical protein
MQLVDHLLTLTVLTVVSLLYTFTALLAVVKLSLSITGGASLSYLHFALALTHRAGYLFIHVQLIPFPGALGQSLHMVLQVHLVVYSGSMAGFADLVAVNQVSFTFTL